MSQQSCHLPTESATCQTANKSAESTNFEPRVDVSESEHEVTLYADLPGVLPENLSVQFEDGELKIQGACPPRNGGTTSLLNEYKVGDFSRSFTLGESLDAERITAELKYGVLTVHLPKVEKAKPKRVEIKA